MADLDPWDAAERRLQAASRQVTQNAAPVLSDDLIAPTPYSWRDEGSIPPRPWLYGRLLLRGTISGVVAPGGVGKSTFLASTALAHATGRPLLGNTVWGGPKRVWLWNLEDDLDELSRSIQASARRYGITAADLGNRLFVDSAMDGAGLCTATEDGDGFRIIEPVYSAITSALIDRGIDLLIIDPFVSSHEVEENANSKIDKIAKRWARVAKAANCAITLVHHTSKAGAGEVNALSARGAVSLINACRSVLVLNRMDKERAEQLGVPDDERRRYFAVEDDKHNRAPAEAADWYRLVSVDLANGDSVGVAEPWAIPQPFDDITPADLLRVQQAIADGDHRQDPQADAWAGYVVARVIGLPTDTKAERRRIKVLIETWIENGALKVVEKRDKTGRHEKKFIEVGRWLTSTSASPRKGDASQGYAVEQQGCVTTTTPLKGVVGDAGAEGVAYKVTQPDDDSDLDEQPFRSGGWG